MECALTSQYKNTLSEITQLAYAAAVDSTKWQLFLDRTSVLCGGIGVHLLGHDDVTNSSMGALYSGYDPTYTDSFNQYYGAINSWAPGFFQYDAGVILHTEMMYPEKKLMDTEFYNDWCKPQEDLRSGGGVILHKEASRMFALGANIRKKDSDKLDKWWLKLLCDVTPHVQQALEISRTFDGMKLEKTSLASTRSPYNAAVIVVSGARQIVYANNEGWKMLEEGRVIKQSLGGQFDFSREEISRCFVSCVTRLSKGSNSLPVAFPTVESLSDSYTCRIVRHTPDILGFSFIETVCGNESSYFLITLAKSAKDIQIKQHLKKYFDVTNAEADVILAIARGQSPESIAMDGGKSIHTVRNQLKRAMSKLSIPRQAGLATYIERLRNTLA